MRIAQSKASSFMLSLGQLPVACKAELEIVGSQQNTQQKRVHLALKGDDKTAPLAHWA